MAHYALLNEQSIVVGVIVGRDEGEGMDWESYYASKTGLLCKRTSYNTRGGVHVKGGVAYRKNYAAKGYSFDAQRDAFIPPRPFPSWTLNEESCTWDPPVPRPEGPPQRWDEESRRWVQPQG